MMAFLAVPQRAPVQIYVRARLGNTMDAVEHAPQPPDMLEHRNAKHEIVVILRKVEVGGIHAQKARVLVRPRLECGIVIDRRDVVGAQGQTRTDDLAIQVAANLEHPLAGESHFIPEPQQLQLQAGSKASANDFPKRLQSPVQPEPRQPSPDSGHDSSGPRPAGGSSRCGNFIPFNYEIRRHGPCQQPKDGNGRQTMKFRHLTLLSTRTIFSDSGTINRSARPR